MNKDVRKLLEKPTAPIPAVGRLFGLSRNGSYEAVKEGRFPVPVIAIGTRRKVAVTAPLLRVLGIEDVA